MAVVVAVVVGDEVAVGDAMAVVVVGGEEVDVSDGVGVGIVATTPGDGAVVVGVEGSRKGADVEAEEVWVQTALGSWELSNPGATWCDQNGEEVCGSHGSLDSDGTGVDSSIASRSDRRYNITIRPRICDQTAVTCTRFTPSLTNHHTLPKS